MALVTTKEMLRKAYDGGYAIGSFNSDSLDIMNAVVSGAKRANSPLIIAVSEAVVANMGPDNAVRAAQTAAEHAGIPIALHLDHSRNTDICKACIDSGFTSVMIDASAYELEKNIAVTKAVADYAHAHGAVTEGELGTLSGVEDDLVVDEKYGQFTRPADALEYVSRTGIDSLAIAIGTAHGAYKFKPGDKPQLRFDILAEVEELLPGFPIVLHGASSVPKDRLDIFNEYGGQLPEAIGIPPEMLREAASRAVCKINVATDIRVCYWGEIRRQLALHPGSFDRRSILEPALRAVTDLVEAKIATILGSADKAQN